MQKVLKVKAGATVILEADVFGKPMPRVTWKRGDDNLKSGEGQVLTHHRQHFQLEMKDVTKEHTGTYTILAENASGSKSAEIQVNVLGEHLNRVKLDHITSCTSFTVYRLFNIKFYIKLYMADWFCTFSDVPGLPANYKYLEVFATSIKLSWEPPLKDGGAPIINYIVDKRETSRPEWAQVASKIKGDVLEFNVVKLIEGREYQLRIRAENTWGVGDPLITNPVIAKNPFSKSLPAFCPNSYVREKHGTEEL